MNPGIPPYAPQDHSRAGQTPCLRSGKGLWQPEAAPQPHSLICGTASLEFGMRGAMAMAMANGGMSWLVVRAAKPCRCPPHVPRLRQRRPPFPCSANS
jgi:hypothetical protein